MSDLPNLDLVALSLNDGVLTICLDRPEKLNAINATLHRSLARAFDFACDCEAARVIVLTGAGRVFSAGGDMDGTPDTVPAFAVEADVAQRIVRRMLDCDKPILCRLNGDAIGVGATLMALSDIVVASQDARIGDPHVRMALVAGDGGALAWPAHVGMMMAKYYLLTGDLMSATEARAMGLVTFCVPDNELDERCGKIAAKLAAGAPLALKWTKRALNISMQMSMSAVFEMSLAAEGLTMLSRDHAEARDAFKSKRKPEFKGE